MRRKLPFIFAALLLILDLSYMGFLAFGGHIEKTGTGKSTAAPVVTAMNNTVRAYQRALSAANTKATIEPLEIESSNTINYLEGYSICKNTNQGQYYAGGAVDNLPTNYNKELTLLPVIKTANPTLPAGYTTQIKIDGAEKDQLRINIRHNGKIAAILTIFSYDHRVNFSGVAAACINLDNMPKPQHEEGDL